jgi:hypothetical protein
MSHRGFYTYALLDSRKKGIFAYEVPNLGIVRMDHEPFYVGKGKGSRDASHLVEAKRAVRSDANLHKLNRIKAIDRDGHRVIVLRISESLSEDAAFIDEENIISEIGRIDLGTGPLTNWSGGGEGVRNVSDATRRKHSIAQTNVRAEHTEEQRIKLAEKISKAVLSRWDGLSQEEKEAHAERTVAQWKTLSPIDRETAMAACRSGYKNWIASLSDDERKKILGSKSKDWWDSLTKEQREEQNRRAASALKMALASRSDEEWESAKRNMSRAQRERLENMSESARAEESARKAKDQINFLAGLSEDERRAHFAKAREGQLKSALQCPHCPVRHVNKPMMQRCHFDNCKKKPN